MTTTEVTTETLRVGDLVIDPRVQRDIIPARVRALARSLDIGAVGTLVVSRRSDGENVVLDGQHRVAALVETKREDYEARCEVHHGLSVAEEASLFRLLNNTRRPSVYDDYTKGVLAGDDECLHIDAILRRHGLHVAAGGVQKGSVRSVEALRRVYRARPAALDQVLRVVIEAWGLENQGAFDGQIISGLGTMLAEQHSELDEAVLVRKLARHPGGPDALLGAARGLRDLRGGSVAKNVARVAVDIYNKGRRGTALVAA